MLGILHQLGNGAMCVWCTLSHILMYQCLILHQQLLGSKNARYAALNKLTRKTHQILFATKNEFANYKGIMIIDCRWASFHSVSISFVLFVLPRLAPRTHIPYYHYNRPIIHQHGRGTKNVTRKFLCKWNGVQMRDDRHVARKGAPRDPCVRAVIIAHWPMLLLLLLLLLFIFYSSFCYFYFLLFLLNFSEMKWLRLYTLSAQVFGLYHE